MPKTFSKFQKSLHNFDFRSTRHFQDRLYHLVDSYLKRRILWNCGLVCGEFYFDSMSLTESIEHDEDADAPPPEVFDVSIYRPNEIQNENQYEDPIIRKSSSHSQQSEKFHWFVCQNCCLKQKTFFCHSCVLFSPLIYGKIWSWYWRTKVTKCWD